MRRRRTTRILLAVTSAQSLKLLSGFPGFLVDAGWDVHVVVGSPATVQFPDGVYTHLVPMVREPSIGRDLVSLVSWVRLLIRVRPTVVVAGTPKAGLLGMLGSALVRVPVRIYLLRGLRLETTQGHRRVIFWALEWLTARLSTRVQAVSFSLARVYLSFRLCSPRQIRVVAHGSSNGVLVKSTDPQHRGSHLAQPPGTNRRITVGFVGRVTADKGIETLLAAFRRSRLNGTHLDLVLAGGEEPIGALDSLCRHVGVERADINWFGSVEDVSVIYEIIDVLCLPTKREGFPNVVLEAAAAGVPAIVSRATGAVDSVVDSETGWLFDVDDVEALTQHFDQLGSSPSTLTQAGRSARAHIERFYRREYVWEETLRFYEAELSRVAVGPRQQRY